MHCHDNISLCISSLNKTYRSLDAFHGTPNETTPDGAIGAHLEMAVGLSLVSIPLDLRFYLPICQLGG
jgi:hypothetical protein